MADEKNGPSIWKIEDTKAVVEWLRKIWTQDRTCPICGTKDWEVPNIVVMAPAASAGPGIVLGGTTVPFLPVICKTCGYQIHFNALLNSELQAALRSTAKEKKG